MSDSVYGAMVEMGAEKSVMVLGSDTTHTMSGADGGAQHFLEQKLNRNVFQSALQPPYRNLFVKLDGETSGKDSFKGPIGKSYKVKKTFFPAVTAGDMIPILPDEVSKDLSWDQKCFYKLQHATTQLSNRF